MAPLNVLWQILGKVQMEVLDPRAWVYLQAHESTRLYVAILASHGRVPCKLRQPLANPLREVRELN